MRMSQEYAGLCVADSQVSGWERGNSYGIIWFDRELYQGERIHIRTFLIEHLVIYLNAFGSLSAKLVVIKVLLKTA